MMPLDGTYPVLAEVLAAAGYRSAGFVANTDYCSEEVGLARGFSRYEDYTLTAGQIARSSSIIRMIARVRLLRDLIGTQDNLGRKTAPMINASFLAWLDRDKAGDHPFFAFLNFYDAHRPYLPPAPFNSRFRTPGVPLVPRLPSELGREPHDSLRVLGAIDAYDNAVSALDASLGDLLRSLETRGALTHTIVIITADHGEEFLEHGAWDHGNTLYLPALRVPLLLLLPDREAAGRTVDVPVSLSDLPATISDLAGLRATPFTGRSLARLWHDSLSGAPDTIISAVQQVPRQAIEYPASAGNMVSLVAGDLHFIRNLGTHREELYDYVKDPFERQDLSQTPAGALALPAFRASAAPLFATAPGPVAP
jgi:arylsulfatase A-like enzyme